jgi:hypothetical protein
MNEALRRFASMPKNISLVVLSLCAANALDSCVEQRD